VANHGSRKNKENSCLSCRHYRICFRRILLMANIDKALTSCREGDGRAIANITVRAEGGTGGSRKTREKWPLLTVETEVNGDSKRVQIEGVLPWLAGWACRAGTRDFLSCLGCSRRLSTKYFFLTVHYFISFVPIAHQPGQAVVLGHLPVS
jgi:hypothetical protein